MATVLSNEDKQIVDDALSLTKELNHSVSTTRTEFEKKGSVGLWWDARGFWNYLDKHAVLKNMDEYKELYGNIITCLELMEEGDEESYEQLLRLYGQLERMEICAKDNAKDSSKALCQVARDFLDHHYKLDHKLKRVECVVLTKNIVKIKELAENLGEMLTISINNLDTLADDNRTMKDSLDVLHEQNRELGGKMTTILRENQELRNIMAEREASSERRIQELVEESRRNMERMMIEIRNERRNRNVDD